MELMVLMALLADAACWTMPRQEPGVAERAIAFVTAAPPGIVDPEDYLDYFTL
jgi:hypothetical protein